MQFVYTWPIRDVNINKELKNRSVAEHMVAAPAVLYSGN